MVDVRIIICAIWIVIMLIYLLGDIIRFLMGDMKPGELNGMPITQGMALTIAVIMLVPIMMVFLTIVLPHPLVRTVNIGVAIVVFLFNLVGLPTYPGAYDRFLLAVSMVFNLVTIGYAWNWV